MLRRAFFGFLLVAACGGRTALLEDDDDVTTPAPTTTAPTTQPTTTAPPPPPGPTPPPPPPVDAAPPPVDAGVEADAPDATLPPIPATPDAAPDLTGCAAGADAQAYVVSNGGDLYAFDSDAMALTLVGHPNCVAGAAPYTMTATREGEIFALYTDWNVYRIDPQTLACAATPYAAPAGAVSNNGIAASRADGDEWLYVYTTNNTKKLLYRASFADFQPKLIGEIANAPVDYPIDFQSDAYGRLFAATATGVVSEIDPSTAEAIGQDSIGAPFPSLSWALLALGHRLYFFSSSAVGSSSVTVWDPDGKRVLGTGSVAVDVVGAAAPPCRP